MDIGSKLKEIRTLKGLTQEELADRAELSKGFISQLERNLTSPSIATLTDILQCLGTTLGEFFNETPEEQVVFGKADYFEKYDAELKNEIRWIIPNAQKNMMEPILITLEAGGSTYPDNPHEGEEFGYVLSGAVTLELGGKTLTFCVSPNIHWPDTMMTYLAEDKILFSCDFLGAHFAEPTMYVHKAYKKELYEKEFKVYYDAIMGPFAKFVIRALDRIKDLDIALVCPSHGPMIMGGDIQVAMDTYRKWATPEEKTDKTVAIYYVSAYGYTRQMCQYLAKKLEAKGLVVSAFDVIKTDAADIAAHLEDDCLVFGSPTLNRAALKPVLDVISSIDAVGAAGRPYATLGCFGWSGEACAQLNDRCNSIKMKQVGESVRSQFTPTDEVWAQLDTLADQIAETVNK